jgi:hypothetical protein
MRSQSLRKWLRPWVSALTAVAALQIGAITQAQTWRDGSAESDVQRLDDWREARRTQQLRDRAEVDRVRDANRAEQRWVWTEQNVGNEAQPLILFRGTPSARGPNR